MTLRAAKRKPESRYLHFCRACRRQFTVTTGTALHRTHVPLEKWLTAITLIKATSRELTAAALVRSLGVTHKTARLMCRRLRRGMKGPFLRNLFVALRAHKKPERIFRNLFPDLYAP
jgi:transposase-like protein